MVTLTPNQISVDLTTNPISLSVVSSAIDVNVDKGNVTYNITQTSQETITASENLGGHRVITIEGYYASKDTDTDKFKVLGLTTGAVSTGASATVQTFGSITENTWNWTVGEPVFLSTNGLLTQTIPTTGYRLIIGIPITTTTLFVDISEPIILI